MVQNQCKWFAFNILKPGLPNDAMPKRASKVAINGRRTRTYHTLFSNLVKLSTSTGSRRFRPHATTPDQYSHGNYATFANQLQARKRVLLRFEHPAGLGVAKFRSPWDATQKVGPSCHGANSSSPIPVSSLLVFSPPATAMIRARMRAPTCGMVSMPSRMVPALRSMSSSIHW